MSDCLNDNSYPGKIQHTSAPPTPAATDDTQILLPPTPSTSGNIGPENVATPADPFPSEEKLTIILKITPTHSSRVLNLNAFGINVNCGTPAALRTPSVFNMTFGASNQPHMAPPFSPNPAQLTINPRHINTDAPTPPAPVAAGCRV